MFNKYIFLLIALFLTSCATQEVRISDLNKPIKMIQSSVFSALPNGRPKIDKTKRKFVSKPFLVKSGLFIPVSNSRVHFISNVEILGDRRPYTIYIESLRMIRDSGQFVVAGQDKFVSEQIAKAIQYQLSKRLKNTDVIDDFRVF